MVVLVVSHLLTVRKAATSWPNPCREVCCALAPSPLSLSRAGVLCCCRGKVYKVPATDMEALRSPLMGLFEKRRARGFFL